MTGDDLRELAARVAHNMPVAEVRDTIPGVLLEAAATLDRLAPHPIRQFIREIADAMDARAEAEKGGET